MVEPLTPFRTRQIHFYFSRFINGAKNFSSRLELLGHLVFALEVNIIRVYLDFVIAKLDDKNHFPDWF